VSLSPDGSRLAAGSHHSDEVWIFNVRDGQVLRKIPAPRARPEFHPSGSLLALGTPSTVTLIGTEDDEVTWRIEREPNLTFPAIIAFDREGHLAAFTYSDTRIWIVESTTGRKLSELEASEPIQVSGLAMEGGTLAASTVGRRFHVWDMNGLGREISRMGLSWDMPAHGTPLDAKPPLRSAVVEPSIDIFDEEQVSADSREIIRSDRTAAFLPRLETYADIDAALACRPTLIAEGDVWRFLRGRDAPSAELEWTSLDHEETGWESGRTPITGRELESGSPGTYLGDQVKSYTTLYLRNSFEIDDPSRISRLILAVEIEDGVVAYWNGEELGRSNAGKPGEPLSFRALAKRTDVTRTTRYFEVAGARLRPGRNVIALQVLSYGLDSMMHALPVLVAEPIVRKEDDRRRTENLEEREGRPELSLLAYREGRVSERAGAIAEALSHFERACEGEGSFAEPLLRRIGCHRALGELARTESLARDAIEKGDILDADRLWRAWLRASFVDLRRSPAEVLASFPRDPQPERFSTSRAYRRLVEELAGERKVRINCGGAEFREPDGKAWLEDCFSLGGSSMEKGKVPAPRPGPPSKDSPPESTERWFPGKSPQRDAYAIPLPHGRHRVSLHFIEWVQHNRGSRIFDIVIEGKVALEGHEPLAAGFGMRDVRSFDVEVVDGRLDVSFMAHKGTPFITDLEVEILDG